MDKSREQFEAWFRRFGSEEECTNMLQLNSYGTNYLHPHADLAWIAWQASRAAIEITPPEFIDSRQALVKGYTVDYSNGYGDAMDAYESGLSAAGLKIRGEADGETDIRHQR